MEAVIARNVIAMAPALAGRRTLESYARTSTSMAEREYLFSKLFIEINQSFTYLILVITIIITLNYST